LALGAQKKGALRFAFAFAFARQQPMQQKPLPKKK
jgi:hypothetical protein